MVGRGRASVARADRAADTSRLRISKTRARTGAAAAGRTAAKTDGDENQVPTAVQGKTAAPGAAKKVAVLQDKAAATGKAGALADKNVPAKTALQSKTANAMGPAATQPAKKVTAAAPVAKAAGAQRTTAAAAGAQRKPLGEVGNVQQHQQVGCTVAWQANSN